MTTVRYHNDHFTDCVALIRQTWNFDRYFPALARPNLANELFFEEAVASANYSEVIVDDGGGAHGYIFGTALPSPGARAKGALGSLEFGARLLANQIAGAFGPRKKVRQTLRTLLSATAELESDRKPEDGYVNLFLVSPALRGQGWGKRLMERYQEHCRSLGIERLYLWTDKSCNYGFYDAQGFERIVEVSSEVFAEYGSEPNGFAYVKVF